MQLNVTSRAINEKYLQRMQETISNALEVHPRLLAICCELRFPQWAKAKMDSAVITRFFESLKAQIEAKELRKAKKGERVHHCTVQYVWVREFGDEKGNKHYHVVLLLNRDAYFRLGDFYNPGNLASMISKAWGSAIGRIIPTNSGLVSYPTQYSPEGKKRGIHHLYRNEVNGGQGYWDLLPYLKYMAKLETKDSDDGERNFGCSQAREK